MVWTELLSSVVLTVLFVGGEKMASIIFLYVSKELRRGYVGILYSL